MTLQFVLGKNGLDHQEKMVEILQKQKLNHPNDQFFYLVPNHIKFESEVSILKQLSDPNDITTAQSDVQVLSFTRLAWFFLRNTPEYQKQRISTAGINMLLYQIIVDNEDKLILFDHEIHNPGFIGQMLRKLPKCRPEMFFRKIYLRCWRIQTAPLPTICAISSMILPLFTRNTSSKFQIITLIITRFSTY